MKMNLRKFAGLVAMALLVTAFMPRHAAAEDQDPPSRVARLSFIQGQVSFNPAGTEEWVGAVLNRPLTTGDKLWTDRDGRAELHIGSGALRIGGQTGFSFLNLSDRGVQVRMTEGVLSIRLKRLEEDETIEVDTPNLAFSLLRPGEYRIEVNEAGDATVITVRGGEGEVTGGGESFTVHAGQRVTFGGTDQLSSSVDAAGEYDDFDDWSRDRERRENTVHSTRYVSRDVVGYEDLDEHGDWQPAPDYGYVWVPRTVVVGWAPYRFGHWVWIWPWGWTWVDDAPWGFAPFHYGRWVFWRARWCWVPGPIVARSVYAPALVAWVGGPRFSVAVGVGPGVGWFPLGPREVFLPPYAVSRVYVTNINITNTHVNNVYVTNVYENYRVNHVTNITYVNRTAPGAVTVVSRETFISARPVHSNLVRVNEREIAAAQVNTAAAVAPQQRSVSGAGQANVARPPASFTNRAVVARATPPPRPVPFAAQQRAIDANGGRPLNEEQVRQLHTAPETQTARPNIRVAPPATRRIPVEMAGPRQGATGGQAGPQTPTGQPGRPAGSGAVSQPPVRERIRDDRPPSAQRTVPQTPPPTTPADLDRRARDKAKVDDQGQKPTPPPANAADLDRRSRDKVKVDDQGQKPNPPPANASDLDRRSRDKVKVDDQGQKANRPPANAAELDRRSRDQAKLDEQRQKMEQKHTQEQENLRVRQDRDHQKLEEKTQRQQQKQQPPPKEKAPKSEDKSKPKEPSSDRKN